MAGRFVGRESELTTLLEVAASGGGRGSAVLVRGGPGFGKSRLLVELRDRVTHVPVLPLTGHEAERQVPFAAARELLGTLSRAPEGTLIERIVGPAAAPMRGTMGGDTIRLLEAAHRAQASLGPAVLVVDDAQWLDSASAALVHYLYRSSIGTRVPLSVVVGGRPSAGLRTLWSSLRRAAGPTAIALDLPPLSVESAAELASVIAPHASPDEIDTAWRQSGGSPFWLERLLVAGPDAGREMISEQLAGLDEDSQRLISLLAVASRPVELDDARALMPRKRLASAFGVVVDAGLAVEAGNTIRMAHDLVRDAVMQTVAPREERDLHAWLAARLEARDDDATSLLEALAHRRAAGQPTAEVAFRVTSMPRRMLLGDEELRHLEAAGETCRPGDQLCDRLNWAIAELGAALGAHEVAYRRFHALIEVESGAGLVGAALGASRAANALGRRDEAWDLLERASRTDSDQAALVVECAAHRSSLLRYRERDPDAAQRAALDAVARSKALVPVLAAEEPPRSEVRHAQITALMAATDAALMVGDPEEMLGWADELAELSASDYPREHVGALSQQALALRFMGRNSDAELRLARAWDIARGHVMPQAMLEVGALRAVVLLSLGRLGEADAVAGELVALGRRLADLRPARAFSVVLPHLISLSRGDWRAAVAGFDEAAHHEPDPHYRLHGHLERAVALSRLDPGRSAAEVVRAIEEAGKCAAQAGCRRCEREVTLRGVEALARVGETGKARRLQRQLVHKPPMPAADRSMAWWAARSESALSIALGHADGGDRLVALTVEAERQDLHLEAAWCRLDLARLLADSDRAAATEVARDAGVAAERMGARTEQQLAEKVLRGLGVRTWKRSRTTVATDGFEALSEREREVVRLAAIGATNPEIAAQVFLSRKTVERHLSNAMGKLGVRNRSELASLHGTHVNEGVAR